MSQASPDLQWQILRKHHSYLIKRDQWTFSSEPNNLTNKHSFKFSGLINKKSVGVQQTKDGKSVQLSIRKVGNGSSRRINRGYTVTPLKHHKQSKLVRSAKTIQSLTASVHYRPDLTKFAIGRYHALHAATKPRKTIAKTRKPRGRKATA